MEGCQAWLVNNIRGAQTGSRCASLGLEMAAPDRDHAFGGLLPWETTMITCLVTAELTVLILLCFMGPDYRH
jgi:hypothetical protein